MKLFKKLLNRKKYKIGDIVSWKETRSFEPIIGRIVDIPHDFHFLWHTKFKLIKVAALSQPQIFWLWENQVKKATKKEKIKYTLQQMMDKK